MFFCLFVFVLFFISKDENSVCVCIYIIYVNVCVAVCKVRNSKPVVVLSFSIHSSTTHTFVPFL